MKLPSIADQSFDEIVNFAVQEIVENVLGGKKSLRATLHWIVDVAARWGKETYKRQEGK